VKTHLQRDTELTLATFTLAKCRISSAWFWPVPRGAGWSTQSPPVSTLSTDAGYPVCNRIQSQLVKAALNSDAKSHSSAIYP
jgi:hypothetical protein